MRQASFYAVARGRAVGVFNTWQKCNDSINGFSGAKFKKFPTLEQANDFIGKHRETLNSGGKVISKKGPVRTMIVKSAATTFAERPLTRNTAMFGGGASNSLAASNLGSVNDGFTTVVYTDGACSRNGFVGAKAGFGVFWSDGHPDNVSAPVNGPPTNNRAEYLAVISALEKATARNIRRLVIRTDSALLIQSMTKWLPKWRTNGWKTINGTDVRNRDLLERLDNLTKGTIDVKFEKVAGHSGDYGNDQADLLARRGAEMYTAKK
ncbi:hypothetical protein niasHT_002163 [Heterodera trifolii]|uniref:Ribonuclease H1 n=1 Tax=Heterodera trifolii TaxID=157864 RepID=A0ABD2LLV9_9BILA